MELPYFLILQEKNIEPETQEEKGEEDRSLTKFDEPQPISENGISTRSSSSLEHKFGLVLKRSGVAITVTSLTDFLAFAVGGTTVSFLQK